MTFSLEKRFMISIVIILGTLAFEAKSRAFAEEFTEDVVTNKFKQWMSQHGRSYPDDMEKEKRLNIFKDNMEYIENFNNQGNRTYKLSLNKFADLSKEEFMTTYTANKMPEVPKTTKPSSRNTSKLVDDYQAEVPESIDWRQKEGVVSPVKDQGQCGCCWAFSTVAAVEGITANGVSLSAQQLLDCVTDNKGCDGGWMDTAFEYIIRKQGITSEDNYRYVAQQSMCQDGNVQPSAQITGYEDVTPNCEEELKAAVARQPVSATITVCPDFQSYGSGVFQHDCGNQPVNHAIAIVGYGTSEDGNKYWLIKNSWGEDWGENGYMRLLRDAGPREGLCGIAMHASYPVIS